MSETSEHQVEVKVGDIIKADPTTYRDLELVVTGVEPLINTQAIMEEDMLAPAGSVVGPVRVLGSLGLEEIVERHAKWREHEGLPMTEERRQEMLERLRAQAAAGPVLRDLLEE